MELEEYQIYRSISFIETGITSNNTMDAWRRIPLTWWYTMVHFTMVILKIIIRMIKYEVQLTWTGTVMHK